LLRVRAKSWITPDWMLKQPMRFAGPPTPALRRNFRRWRYSDTFRPDHGQSFCRVWGHDTCALKRSMDKSENSVSSVLWKSGLLFAIHDESSAQCLSGWRMAWVVFPEEPWKRLGHLAPCTSTSCRWTTNNGCGSTLVQTPTTLNRCQTAQHPHAPATRDCKRHKDAGGLWCFRFLSCACFTPFMFDGCARGCEVIRWL